MHNRPPLTAPCLFTEGIWQRGTPHNTTLFLTSAIGGRPDGQRWACLHTRVGGEPDYWATHTFGPLHIQHEVCHPVERGPAAPKEVVLQPGQSAACQASSASGSRQQLASGQTPTNRWRSRGRLPDRRGPFTTPHPSRHID